MKTFVLYFGVVYVMVLFLLVFAVVIYIRTFLTNVNLVVAYASKMFDFYSTN